MNFLIVDDESAARRDLRKVINRVAPDAEITEASNATTALDICRNEAPDVVFMDIRMPKTDGIALAEQIIEILPSINVIMVTAYPEYALEAHRLFVSGYILKPAMEEDVREALEHLRTPVERERTGLYVQCFGNFEVFYDKKTLQFKRSQ